MGINERSGSTLWQTSGGNQNLLVWSLDGKAVAATGGAAVDVKLWDAESGTARQSLLIANVPYVTRSLAWSKDGSKLAVGCNAKNSNQIVVWELNPERRLNPLVDHGGAVVALHWAEDGTLVSLGEDRTVRFWNPATGRLNNTVTAPAKSGVFSPDGKRVASQVANAIRLWQADTGRVDRTMLLIGGDQYVSITGDGQITHSPDLRTELVYILLTADGQHLTKEPPADLPKANE